MRPLVYSDTITIRTDADLRRAIDAAAQREGASASEWVRRALGTIVQTDGPPRSPTPASPAIALPVAARAMDRLDAPEFEPDPTAQVGEPLTPLQVRIGACCADTAASFRAIAAVSAQIARVLETDSGSPEDLCGLVRAYEELQEPAGSRLACLGAAISSAGSA